MSRKMRRLLKIGKKPLPVIDHNDLISQNGEEGDQKLPKKTSPEISLARSGNFEKKNRPVFTPLGKEKSQEIFSHLKIVFSVSFICLIFLSILYFLELRIGWVENVNNTIKSLLASLDWKI